MGWLGGLHRGWATLLWLPDLLLPRDRGHVGNDLIELAWVIAVAVFVGCHIDRERLERAKADRARSEQQAVEVRYRQLFDTNTARSWSPTRQAQSWMPTRRPAP